MDKAPLFLSGLRKQTVRRDERAFNGSHGVIKELIKVLEGRSFRDPSFHLFI